MKTKLPTELTTIADVEQFIADLHTNNELFHLDDNAADIVIMYPEEQRGLRLFTDEEATKINELIEQAFNICEVWELPIIDKILDEITSQE